jgi:hypothetical protein
MAVASVALFVSLGGIGYAAATGSIDSREIRNNSVRGKDVRNNNLTGKDLRDNRITGADVRESSLGEVPSATSADTAASAASADSLGGLRVLPIRHRSGAVTNGTLLDVAGLRLIVTCEAGDEDMRAITTVANGEIDVISDDAGTADQDVSNLDHQSDTDFNPGEEFPLRSDPTAADHRIYQLHYLGGDGASVSAMLTANESNGGDNCLVSGYAVVI